MVTAMAMGMGMARAHKFILFIATHSPELQGGYRSLPIKAPPQTWGRGFLVRKTPFLEFGLLASRPIYCKFRPKKVMERCRIGPFTKKTILEKRESESLI
jgi:hypothetical protein